MTALALRFGSMTTIDYFRYMKYEYAINKGIKRERERESNYF